MKKESREQRSRIMRAVKSADTRPEMKVRRLLHAMGYRYRLHRKDLPCKPDIVFPARRKVIFIHGCFWHGHDCKRGARLPKSNREYWRKKIARNMERDRRCLSDLAKEGWKCLVLWECGLSEDEKIRQCLTDFLNDAAQADMSAK
jgi:DNA mismatch endonuclease (patch repair protein)